MSASARDREALLLFYSYSHKDRRLRDSLETHLALLRREGLIAGWHDRNISAGREWENAIDEWLERAKLVLLLISADFIASDYCYDRELKRALEKHEAGETRVIPIILRPADWKSAPFGKLLALPTDGKPVTKWRNRDEAWANVAQGIRAAIQELLAEEPVVAESTALVAADNVVGADEDELGWLDFAAEIEESTNAIRAHMSRLDEIVTRFEPQVKARVVSLQLVGSRGSAVQVRAALSAVAAALTGFAQDVENELPEFHESWDRLASNSQLFSATAPINSDADRASVLQLISRMESFQEGLQKPIHDLRAQRESLAELRGYSQDLNRAIRRNEQALDGVVKVLAAGESYAVKLRDILSKRLGV